MSRSHRIALASVAFGAVAAIGCSESVVTPEDLDRAAFEAADRSTADVRARDDVRFFVPGAGEVVGTMQVIRRDDGVNVSARTSELEPGHVYTAWLVLFELPDIPIFSPPPVRLDGKVAGGNGKATFAGNFTDIPPEHDPRELGVHLIVRSHGPAVPGQIDEQMATAGGGCDPSLPMEGGANTGDGSVPDEVGECANVQDAVSLP